MAAMSHSRSHRWFSRRLGSADVVGAEHLFEDVLDLVEDRCGVDAVADHELVQHLLVHLGVGGLLADEAAHVVGQLRILDQWQRLVEGVDEPPLGRGQHDVEQADHVRGDRVAGNPVQRDAGDVEVHLAGLDLYRARVDLLFETARTQHCGLLRKDGGHGVYG